MNTWNTLRALSAWLDEANGTGDAEAARRLLKIVEEAGETATAYIGVTGQNPRKGVTHTREDLIGELFDTAISALVASFSFCDDPETEFHAKLGRIAARSAVDAGPSATATPDMGHWVLNTPIDDADSGAATIREYLVALATQVWNYGEDFSGKRPFGNSGWRWDVYAALEKAGLIEEDDREKGDELMRLALAALKETPR